MTLAFMGLPGGMEWVVILVIGLLLFGSRLPEVGRSLGRSIVEFKKGIKGVEEEIEDASSERRREQGKPALASPSGDPRRVSTTDRVEESV